DARAREFETQAAELKAFKDTQAAAQADPLAFFERLTGINEDGILDLVVKNRAKPTPTAEDRVAALERQLQERDQRAQQEAQQARLSAWRDSVVQTVTAAGEKYDLVNSLGQHDLVIETITTYARQYGKVIDPDVAAAQVEKYLEAGLAKAKKYGPRASAAPAVKPAAAAKPRPTP